MSDLRQNPSAGPNSNSIDIPFLEKAPKYVPRPVCIPKTIEVPIHFTVFTTNVTTSRIVTPEILEEQLRMTNEAFKPLGISFFFATLNYHVGEEFRSFTQHMMSDNAKSSPAYQANAERVKLQNRYGGNDEVNIWIVESIDTPTCAKRTDGYCTPASWLRQPNHAADGCVIEIDALPGVAWRFDAGGTGSTLTHEIGHWFNLWHVFPDKEGAECSGSSDGVDDTFQFPNKVPDMFQAFQRRCCSTGTGRSLKWDFCSTNDTVHVTNYMSYGGDKGEIVEADPDETKPWTTMQRARMFTAFFTMRRAAPSGGIEPTCLNQHVVFEAPPPVTPPASLTRRGLQPRSLRGLNLLLPSDKILGTLRRVCASPPGATSDEQAIDVISGEEIRCNPTTGVCEPPSIGPSCPDSSPPPCNLDAESCAEGGVSPPCPPDLTASCPDGTAPPCAPLPLFCPNGTSLQCIPNNDAPRTPDKAPPPEKPDKSTPVPPGTEPGPEPSSCPRPCTPHSHTCDPSTAPTCIFPDPRLPRPRAFCACRPGYRASPSPSPSPADPTRLTEWRLPIVGQEHRVWVAEGVSCDTLCREGGCGEVAVVGIGCAGGG